MIFFLAPAPAPAKNYGSRRLRLRNTDCYQLNIMMIFVQGQIKVNGGQTEKASGASFTGYFLGAGLIAGSRKLN